MTEYQISPNYRYMEASKNILARIACFPIFNRIKRNFGLRVADGKKQNADYIFTFHGEPVMDVKTAFRVACGNAGVEDFRFHDLRHTFASQLILKGGTLKDVQELLGHRTMTMTLRYAHLTQEHKRKAVNLQSSLPAPKKTETATCHKRKAEGKGPRLTY